MLVSGTTKQAASPSHRSATRKLDRKTRKVAAKKAAHVSPTNTVHRTGALVYSASPKLGPNASTEQVIDGLRLQINALQLSLMEHAEMIEALSRGSSIGHASQEKAGYSTAATPFNGNVIPMSTSHRQAEKARKAAMPVSQPGNEAEVLDLEPGVQLLPPPPDVSVQAGAAVVPITHKRSAAIATPVHRVDESVLSEPKVVRTTTLLGRFGFDENEQLDILAQEYKRRDLHARTAHDMSYDEIRLKRIFRRPEAEYMVPSRCESFFGTWYASTEPKMRVKRNMLAHDTTAMSYLDSMVRVSLCKAGITEPHSKMLKAKRKALAEAPSLREKAGHLYVKVLAKRKHRFHSMDVFAHPYVSKGTLHSTSRSALSTVKDVLNRFTPGGIDWGASRRAKMAAIHDLDRKTQGLPLPRAYVKPWSERLEAKRSKLLDARRIKERIAARRERSRLNTMHKVSPTTTQAALVREFTRKGYGH
jgi:hypothetical protein